MVPETTDLLLFCRRPRTPWLIFHEVGGRIVYFSRYGLFLSRFVSVPAPLWWSIPHILYIFQPLHRVRIHRFRQHVQLFLLSLAAWPQVQGWSIFMVLFVEGRRENDDSVFSAWSWLSSHRIRIVPHNHNADTRPDATQSLGYKIRWTFGWYNIAFDSHLIHRENHL